MTYRTFNLVCHNGFLVCSSTATFNNKKRGDNTPLVACQAFSRRPFKEIGIVSALGGAFSFDDGPDEVFATYPSMYLLLEP